jgi:hypothetical protein
MTTSTGDFAVSDGDDDIPAGGACYLTPCISSGSSDSDFGGSFTRPTLHRRKRIAAEMRRSDSDSDSSSVDVTATDTSASSAAKKLRGSAPTDEQEAASEPFDADASDVPYANAPDADADASDVPDADADASDVPDADADASDVPDESGASGAPDNDQLIIESLSQGLNDIAVEKRELLDRISLLSNQIADAAERSIRLNAKRYALERCLRALRPRTYIGLAVRDDDRHTDVSIALDAARRRVREAI